MLHCSGHLGLSPVGTCSILACAAHWLWHAAREAAGGQPSGCKKTSKSWRSCNFVSITPRDLLESLSLKVFKNHGDVAQRDVVSGNIGGRCMGWTK